MAEYDPMSAEERAEQMLKPRPRQLPIAPHAPPGRRTLPLAPARDSDRAFQPIYAVWEVTLQCDLACRHCGSRAGHERSGELSTVECLDLIRQMAELGVRETTLIGGEAYLRDDWLDLVRELKRVGISPTMTTGGRGITAERAQQAKAAGMDSVSVSIDGSEATHDRLRGVSGSHRAALQALRHLREADVRVSTNTQIN